MSPRPAKMADKRRVALLINGLFPVFAKLCSVSNPSMVGIETIAEVLRDLVKGFIPGLIRVFMESGYRLSPATPI